MAGLGVIRQWSGRWAIRRLSFPIVEGKVTEIPKPEIEVNLDRIPYVPVA